MILKSQDYRPNKLMENEKIEISKSELAEIYKRLDSLAADNEFLKSVADKKAVALYYQRHKEVIPPRVNIRALDVANEKGEMVEKVILGWRTVENEVWKDPQTGAWREKQTVELLMEDKSVVKMDLLNYVRQFKYIPCERTAVIKDEVTGEQAFKLRRLDNGKEYIIGVLFVN